MESGNPVSYRSINGTDFYQPLYDKIVEQAGCSNQTDTLQCLRFVSSEQFNAIINNSGLSTSFFPVVDGDFIQRYGSIQLTEGAFVPVPIISGANTDEGTILGADGFNDDANFLAYLESKSFFRNMHIQALFNHNCTETPQVTGLELNSSLAQQILAAYPNPIGMGQDGIPAEVPSLPTIPFGTQYCCIRRRRLRNRQPPPYVPILDHPRRPCILLPLQRDPRWNTIHSRRGTFQRSCVRLLQHHGIRIRRRTRQRPTLRGETAEFL